MSDVWCLMSDDYQVQGTCSFKLYFPHHHRSLVTGYGYLMWHPWYQALGAGYVEFFARDTVSVTSYQVFVCGQDLFKIYDRHHLTHHLIMDWSNDFLFFVTLWWLLIRCHSLLHYCYYRYFPSLFYFRIVPKRGSRWWVGASRFFMIVIALSLPIGTRD
jgi:hypothetical protein